MTETKRRRGRPRPQEVIDRDEQVFRAVAGSDRAVTKYEIEAGTGIPARVVYMSLRRLSLANRLQRVHIEGKQHFWSDRPQKEANTQPVLPFPELDGAPTSAIPAAIFHAPAH